MQNDIITLNDLSIFTADGSESVFTLIDKTSTQVGREMLRKHLQNPPNDYNQLIQNQDIIKFWHQNLDLWPKIILNGTIVMLEKFFESADSISAPPHGFTLLFNSYFQKLFNKDEYFLIRFTLSHLSDFLKGCRELTNILNMSEIPILLQKDLSC